MQDDLVRATTSSWGLELCHRLSKSHEHLILLPRLAQVISLVGWPKHVKFFFFFIQQLVGEVAQPCTSAAARPALIAFKQVILTPTEEVAGRKTDQWLHPTQGCSRGRGCRQVIRTDCHHSLGRRHSLCMLTHSSHRQCGCVAFGCCWTPHLNTAERILRSPKLCIVHCIAHCVLYCNAAAAEPKESCLKQLTLR